MGAESTGVPVPGETALITAAIPARHGRFNIALVIAVAPAGAIVGDNVGYLIGLERCNREIGRRTDVAGIFPDDASVIRVVSMLAIEANDQWLVGRAYISQKSMAPLFVSKVEQKMSINNEPEEVAELLAA